MGNSFTKEVKKLHEKGVRIRTIGDLSRFDQDIQDSIAKWVEETAKLTKPDKIYWCDGSEDEARDGWLDS